VLMLYITVLPESCTTRFFIFIVDFKWYSW
jgi:hypothetical protein